MKIENHNHPYKPEGCTCTFPHWKEKFDAFIPEKTSKSTREVKHFISKEIIEKLIDDIPDGTLKCEGYVINMRPFKKQLRKDWL